MSFVLQVEIMIILLALYVLLMMLLMMGRLTFLTQAPRAHPYSPTIHTLTHRKLVHRKQQHKILEDLLGHGLNLLGCRTFIEPKTFQQARRKQEWVKAMKLEIDALEQNCTWEVTPLPKEKRAIGCRWIFQLKLKPDGTIDRHKARLVAKGYNQIEKIDYFDSFSLVAKVVIVNTLLVVTASLQWHIHQVDINNAFLHGYLDEEIYMTPPEGYSIPPRHVCRLIRSLYRLKQASRQWNIEFTSKLETCGFHQSKHDHFLFTKSGTLSIVLLLVYVDDILVGNVSSPLSSKDLSHNAFRKYFCLLYIKLHF
ncbi:UNVERIFIED_CONTAM: Retrovirus-related Pol polyprotein from transposon RE1 [Sesamum latifolium]|uniref:Retrovirus-related Pol polyprotein from transposon RE1 n=1 Tax=Sesamum latifolium TaxID=2727402 RepID=A0AAW2U4R0_9LAMI